MPEEPEYVRAARARALTAEQRNPAMRTEREVVHVAEIPTPPPSPMPATAAPADEILKQPMNIEEAVSEILKSSAADLSEKLGQLGVRFDERRQADMVDYCFALLVGNAGGGAIARRR